MTIDDIKKEAKAIRTRIWRCHDKRGMMKLKARIVRLETDIELLRERCASVFRKSYQLDFWTDGLLRGLASNRIQVVGKYSLV